MQYQELKKELKDFSVFSLWDIRKVDANFHRPRLNEWQKRGYLKKLRRGYYTFADTPPRDEESLFLIANELYKPSYVSLEAALSYYGLIPEGVYSITSMTSKKTAKFKTPVGEFWYRNIKPELLFGYELKPIDKQHYKIAEKEKAVLDYLYLNPRMADSASWEGWRFNGEEFLATADREKFIRYAEGFGNAGFRKRANHFLDLITTGRI